MTFIGSINADLRAIVARYAQEWAAGPIAIGCSGNFTVERILAKAGATDLHGNDVSLYSSTVGRYLAGESFAPTIADPDWDWLQEYLDAGLRAIATLLLCTTMLEGLDRPEAFFVRRRAAYRSQWQRLHEQTVKRVEKALEGVRLASWNPPAYEVFDKTRLGILTDLMLQRERWLFARDEPVEQLQDYQVGQVQTTLRAKPLYIYARSGRAVLTAPVQHTEQVWAPRLDPAISLSDTSRLSVAPLSQPQFNLLRSEYLNPRIAPAVAQLRLAVLVDNQLIGAMAFNRPQWGGADAYLLSDFAIRPTRYPRLSKLVLAATLSTEVRQLVECVVGGRVRVIVTTAFTDRPASAKYRGLYTLDSRKSGRLQYRAIGGRWTLQEGLRWWLRHHSTSSTSSTDD